MDTIPNHWPPDPEPEEPKDMLSSELIRVGLQTYEEGEGFSLALEFEDGVVGMLRVGKSNQTVTGKVLVETLRDFCDMMESGGPK